MVKWRFTKTCLTSRYETYKRKKCFKRYFDDVDVRIQVNIEFANFSDGIKDFADVDSLKDRRKMMQIMVDYSWNSCTNTSKDSSYVT